LSRVNRRRSARRGPSRAIVLVLLILVSCAGRPARFARRAAVLDAGDRAPIAMPRPRPDDDRVDVSDLYLRYAVVGALDPSRVPEAGDVNALDEVPRSSWFSDDPSSAFPGLDEGPPRPPLTALPAPTRSLDDGLAVVDARGARFEIELDPPDRPEMRSASAAIASRLLRAVGYAAADAWAIDLGADDLVAPRAGPTAERLAAWLAPARRAADGRLRVSATRWPVGQDLGSTPASEARLDDPNDRVAHRDRRLLRAFQVVTAWLRLPSAGQRHFRDAYVGEPGRGHVAHLVTGLGGALGASRVIRPGDVVDDEAPTDPLEQLGSLGLWRAPRVPTQLALPALGEIDERAPLGHATPWPPYEPADRALPGDLYWAAKRVAAVGSRAIERAVAAGRMSDPAASERLVAILRARQREVVARYYAAVTPCEPLRLDEGALVLRDEALRLGLKPEERRRYLVERLDGEGRALAPEELVTAEGSLVRVEVPRTDVPDDYLVVRVAVVRDGRAGAPLTVHLRAERGFLEVLGVRH
jgi:hypothetical protein